MENERYGKSRLRAATAKVFYKLSSHLQREKFRQVQTCRANSWAMNELHGIAIDGSEKCRAPQFNGTIAERTALGGLQDQPRC